MTIISRSALVAWGRNPPPELHSIVNDPRHGRRVVTWDDVMRERREQQRLRLARKRQVCEWKPYKVWVAYFNQFLFGGWHAFIENRDGCTWITNARDGRLIQPLMDLFPMTLSLGAEKDAWERWKIEFAKSHQRGRQCRKPRGFAVVWWNGHDAELRRGAT